MFSASLNKELFLQLKKEFKSANKGIYDCSSKINSWFISLKKINGDLNEFTLDQLDEELVLLLNQFKEGAEIVLIKETFPTLLELYFQVNSFLKIVDLLDEHYVIYGEKNKNDVTLKLFCIDPSKLLQKWVKAIARRCFFQPLFHPFLIIRIFLAVKRRIITFDSIAI
jgi:Rad3-related DNA helicase